MIELEPHLGMFRAASRAAFDRSLRTLRDLDIEYVLVGHGDPVAGDGRRPIALALG